ncbi:Rieske (2Fe-2S) protein [Hoeflea sp. WL0058]|uniref:Rieske (2Fe-2S) protein n=1 Tax=Flavimaribacter sediminis TaxID=2865987 RepID=A0AAE2ZSV5_9HYPH|nr:Rieske (2Fe-2S) protein [Flavimaribacter sediminis]MBW8638882.1 Rieske (2Fe-2S) protein [Flavimaribacter sediminis]
MTAPTGWIPVALSSEIEAGASAGAVVDGNEVVVWRDTSGVAHTWEDRCPHRGMRMSLGFVRGDHIACLYHGWQYDTAGQCRYIPAHPDLDVPQTIKVPTYVTSEANGIVWSTLSDAVPDEAIPGETDEVTPLRSLYVDCPAAFVRETLETASMPGFSGSEGETVFTAVSDVVWTLTSGEDRLYIGVQTVNPSRTALHVVIAGPQATYAGAGQAHFSGWLETLRRSLEDDAPDEAISAQMTTAEVA